MADNSVVSQISLHNITATQAGRYDCVSFTRLDSVSSRPGYITVNGEIISNKKMMKTVYINNSKF